MNLNNKLLAQEGIIENPLAGKFGKGGTAAGTAHIGSIIVSILNVMIIAGAVMLLYYDCLEWYCLDNLRS